MDAINENEILTQVLDKLISQTNKGIEKYGHTVNPKEYDITGWVDHLQQELIDALVYSTIIKMRAGEDSRQGMLEDYYVENERLRNQLESERKHKVNYREIAFRYQDEKNRYRETLEFYAKSKNYEETDRFMSVINSDSGFRARKTLEEPKWI